MQGIPETIHPSIKESKSIFKKFEAKFPPSGLIFSHTYKPLITGFFKKSYYIIILTSGDMDDGEFYQVGEWCDTFYKFKNKEEMLTMLAIFAKQNYEASKIKGRNRNSVLGLDGDELKKEDWQPYIDAIKKKQIIE